MSFGLLTAINLEDIPKVLQRCAQGWRNGAYARYPVAWQKVADEVDRFAAELQEKIPELKKSEPRRRTFLD